MGAIEGYTQWIQYLKQVAPQLADQLIATLQGLPGQGLNSSLNSTGFYNAPTYGTPQNGGQWAPPQMPTATRQASVAQASAYGPPTPYNSQHPSIGALRRYESGYALPQPPAPITGPVNPYQWGNIGKVLAATGAGGPGVAAVPDWMLKLYPGLKGMNMNQLAEFMANSKELGLPAGWNSQDALGYANLDWQKQQFNQQFPEANRQWQAQFDQGAQGQAFNQQMAQLQNAQQFGQQGIANQQWGQQFGMQAQNQLWNQGFQAQQLQQAADQFQQQYGFQNKQLQQAADQFKAQFEEARRQSDISNGQWGQQFGLQKQGQEWNQAFQGSQAAQSADQFAKQFGLQQQGQTWNQNMGERQQSQAEQQSQWARAMDEWNKAQQQAGFEWQKQQAAEQNKLTEQGQNLAAFGRRIGPNLSAM